MSDFVRSRLFFILTMVSLSIAQGLVVHAGQTATNKLNKILPSPVALDILKTYP
ncbi:MAG: hypothetical protein KF798_02420 [Candidatus Paracaedibacteraceae bacterium]|nr:hypothetical protein [Candidatus Paracaedibacteraceae bacterium]